MDGLRQKNSPKCQEFMKKRFGRKSVDSAKLKEYYMSRVGQIAFQNDMDLAAWEDGISTAAGDPYNRSSFPNRDVFAYSWNNVWEWGNGASAYKLANSGYKVKSCCQL